MTVEEYQSKTLDELFNCELIEETIPKIESSLTVKQETILSFIAENPNVKYITLQNIFRVRDSYVVDLVIHYGSRSEERERLNKLRKKIKDT